MASLKLDTFWPVMEVDLFERSGEATIEQARHDTHGVYPSISLQIPQVPQPLYLYDSVL